MTILPEHENRCITCKGTGKGPISGRVCSMCNGTGQSGHGWKATIPVAPPLEMPLRETNAELRAKITELEARIATLEKGCDE